MAEDPRSTRGEPTDLGNQPALRSGNARRWLIPAALLAAIGITLFGFAVALQPIVAAVGIAFTAGVFAAMCLATVGLQDVPIRNRLLAWLMGIMAVGILALLLLTGVLEANAV